MTTKHPARKRYPLELRVIGPCAWFAMRSPHRGGETYGVVVRVARQLGVGPKSLRSWLKQAEIDSGARPGTSTADAQRSSDVEETEVLEDTDGSSCDVRRKVLSALVKQAEGELCPPRPFSEVHAISARLVLVIGDQSNTVISQ